ncbi:MAG TPA: T9SS type A sorting domain-containing protein [Flavobacteriales bacterium]|nr:T9SS type A sorting domain-containing protein [Flavobacteriales bacterium]HIO72731.1 T9SS type A sorting domain-containing protein [Flavobacteriales bacterium]
MHLMKTNTLLLLSFLTLSVLPPNIAKAQTSIQLSHSQDSIGYLFCPVPTDVSFMIWGQADGYTPGTDVMTININYGDGSDTTFMEDLNGNSPQWFNVNWLSATHIYTSPGSYSVRVIATGPDSQADTLIIAPDIVVGDTCGNISGRVYMDLNSDCVQDNGEDGILNFPVVLYENSQFMEYTYTNVFGDYWFDVPQSTNYEVRLGDYWHPGITPICPSSGSLTLASVPSFNNDYSMECSLTGYDLSGDATGALFRPGFNNGVIWFNISNSRCATVSGDVTLVLDPLLTLDLSQISPTPTSINGDSITWNFTDLDGMDWLSFTLAALTTDSTAVLGDSICVLLIIEPITGDFNPQDNVVEICFPIMNSWDPNIKEVEPAGIGTAGSIDRNEDLTYTVHFQNTGNAPAINVFIKDTLDENLDLSSFRLLSSSHAVETDIRPSGLIKFSFDDIMLADSVSDEPQSHGYVSFRISQKTDLPYGTEIQNTAAIYFDFNPPVITNTVLNTIDSIGIVNGLEETSVAHQQLAAIYPNPATTVLYVDILNELGAVQLYLSDMLGQEVLALQDIRFGKNAIDLSSLTAGMYLVQIRSTKSSLSKRIVVTQ